MTSGDSLTSQIRREKGKPGMDPNLINKEKLREKAD
jgi:hypothetical protein